MKSRIQREKMSRREKYNSNSYKQFILETICAKNRKILEETQIFAKYMDVLVLAKVSAPKIYQTPVLVKMIPNMRSLNP